MHIPSQHRTPGLIALSLGAALLFSPMAQAASSAEAQYQADVQRCQTTPGIDKAACLQEAGAALEATRRNKLTAPDMQAQEANETARCKALPASEQSDCLTLMSRGKVIEGSVSGGGVLRETTITTTPAPAASTSGTVSSGSTTGTIRSGSTSGTVGGGTTTGTTN